GFFGPAGEHDRVVLRKELTRVEVDADMRAVMEHDAFRLHLRNTPVDMLLLHLEIRNAVAQKTACLGPSLIDVNVVSGTGKLLCTGKTGRAGSDDCYCLAGTLGRRLWLQPLRNGAVGNRAFDRFDGDRVLVDIERARGFAGRRTYAARHFRKVIGRVQIARG